MAQPAGTRTLQHVIEHVTQQFGDVASVQIDVAKITAWANMAILEIVNRDPGCYKVKATTASVKGTSEYTFPVGIIECFSIWYNGNILSNQNFENLSEQVGIDGGNNTRGIPLFWTQWGNTFNLYPIPDADDKVITVYFTAKPSDLVSASELLPLSDKYFARICEYVMSKAQELDEDYVAAAGSRDTFEQGVIHMLNSADRSSGQNFVLDDQDDGYYYD